MSVEEQLREHLARAERSLARGADEAAGALGEAIALAPGDLAIRQQLAELLARTGQTGAASEQLLHVAGRFAADGQLLKALALARIVAALAPQETSPLRALAALFARQPDGEQAAPSLPASMSGALGGPSARIAQLDLRLRALPHPGQAPLPARTAPAGEPASLEGAALQAPLFSALPEEAFVALAARLQLRWTRPGEVIVEAGEPGDAMFIVVQGTVEVFNGRPGASAAPVAQLREGSFFGEKALLAEASRLATVVAAGDGLLFSLSRAALDALEAEHPGTRKAVEELFRARLLDNLLSVSPLFRVFAPAQKRELAGRFWVRDLLPGTLLLEQGKPGAGFFVLLRGECDAFHTGEDGARRSYPTMKAGDVFGEISLLFDTPCTASVQSATPCEVLVLPKQDFDELILPNAEAKKLIEQLAQERLGRTADLLQTAPEVQSTWLV